MAYHILRCYTKNENSNWAFLFISLPPCYLDFICPPASVLRSPFHHHLSVPVCSPSNTPSQRHWSPGDVSLLRSDVVGHANRPSRPLLLTRPSLHFSKLTETQHRSTNTQKVQKRTHNLETHRDLTQFFKADKQTPQVFLCINNYIWFNFHLVVELMN